VGIVLVPCLIESRGRPVIKTNILKQNIHLSILHDWIEANRSEKMAYNMDVDYMEAIIDVGVFEWLLLIMKLIDAILSRIDFLPSQLNILRLRFANLIGHQQTQYNSVFNDNVHIKVGKLSLTMNANDKEQLFNGEITDFNFLTNMQRCNELYTLNCKKLLLKCPPGFDSLVLIKLEEYQFLIDIKNYKYSRNFIY
jgi:hypothetical protein